jgi:hypothetical protein
MRVGHQQDSLGMSGAIQMYRVTYSGTGCVKEVCVKNRFSIERNVHENLYALPHIINL